MNVRSPPERAFHVAQARGGRACASPLTAAAEGFSYAPSPAPISAPGQRDGHPGQSLPR